METGLQGPESLSVTPHPSQPENRPFRPFWPHGPPIPRQSGRQRLKAPNSPQTRASISEAQSYPQPWSVPIRSPPHSRGRRMPWHSGRRLSRACRGDSPWPAISACWQSASPPCRASACDGSWLHRRRLRRPRPLQHPRARTHAKRWLSRRTRQPSATWYCIPAWRPQTG